VSDRITRISTKNKPFEFIECFVAKNNLILPRVFIIIVCKTALMKEPDCLDLWVYI